MRGFTLLENSQRIAIAPHVFRSAGPRHRKTRKANSLTGFTLIEIVVYIAILAAVSVVAVETVLRINRALAAIRVTRTLDIAAAAAMERTIRTIRDAKAVDAAGSVFGVSPGILKLTGAETPPATRRFTLSGGSLQYEEGGNPAIALTPPGVSVIGLVFRGTTTPHSTAIRIELTLAASSGRATTTQSFYDTAVLRNSYVQ